MLVAVGTQHKFINNDFDHPIVILPDQADPKIRPKFEADDRHLVVPGTKFLFPKMLSIPAQSIGIGFA